MEIGYMDLLAMTLHIPEEELMLVLLEQVEQVVLGMALPEMAVLEQVVAVEAKVQELAHLEQVVEQVHFIQPLILL